MFHRNNKYKSFKVWKQQSHLQLAPRPQCLLKNYTKAIQQQYSYTHSKNAPNMVWSHLHHTGTLKDTK